MKNITKVAKVGLLIMGILSIFHLINFRIGINLAIFGGLTVPIGLVFFFLNMKYDKYDYLLDFKKVPEILKNKKIFLLVLLPILMDILNLFIAKIAVPGIITQLKSRTEFLTGSVMPIFLFRLVLRVFGEEIAWRGFFQNQLTKGASFKSALFISSILFTIAHYNPGDKVLVLYDLLFVFINTLIYGILLYKTENIYIATLAHFLSNLFGVIVIFAI